MKKIFFLFLAVTLLFTGCEREIGVEPIEGDSSLIPLNIDGSINQVQTKATAAGFVDKDALGLFAVNYSEGNTVAGTLAASGNQADNVKYIFDEPEYKWTPVKSVYYKDINTNVDLYLYYPYQASIRDVNASGFEVQKDQSAAATSTSLSGFEASDFLWGKATGVVPSESKVAVSLSHKMSAVNVTLVEKDGFDEGEFDSLEKSVILTNTTRKATIDYATGEVTALGSPQLDGIVMCPQDGESFRAIVVPQSIDAGVQLFAITIDGVPYSFAQNSESVVYQSGKQMDVSINISKKAQTGEYTLELAEVQIVDWREDRNTHGGEARQYYVVNVETPGTLGRLIKKAGKNPDKIKNLKVSGIIDIWDYAFMRDSMAILENLNLYEVSSQCYDIRPESGVPIQDCWFQTINEARDYFEHMDVILLYRSGGNSVGYLSKSVYSQYQDNIVDNVIPRDAFSWKKSLYNCTLPNGVKAIGEGAFSQSNLSGPLVLPSNVEIIGAGGFNYTNISSVSFPGSLTYIGRSAFNECSSLSGNLYLPSTVRVIGDSAFQNCSFSGVLSLPENLEYLGGNAFRKAGSFVGDLIIPEKINEIKYFTFFECKFHGGRLFLNNVTTLESNAFDHSCFSGELVIPEGTVIIPEECFDSNDFDSVILPSTLKGIDKYAFSNNYRLSNPVLIPEGVIYIGNSAFDNCNQLQGISLPSTLQTIKEGAFYNCNNLSRLRIDAIDPPTVQSEAFTGVAKDNFTVEVPEQSVSKYSTEPGWSEFRRIAAHYDFSPSRSLIRALNAEESRTLVLRAPANFSWSIEDKPDWVTVSPSSGIGKTDITITIDNMSRTSNVFEVNEGSFQYPNYVNYAGRSGEIIFKLDDKDYTCSIRVEQYDSDYIDGQVIDCNTASKGSGIDIVFIGDGYDAKDIATGKFLTDSENGFNSFFGLEPYKSYKDYFNVYAVVSKSDDSGIGTVNTVVDTKFGSYFTQNRIMPPSADDCFAWAKKANSSMDLTKSLTILLMNTSTYEGVTMMYGDGSAIACCPVSQDAYPYDFRGIIQHEAGGHGFGKLGDEYIYHNAFIQTCICTDGCDHPQGEDDMGSTFGQMKSRGWFRNLSMISDMHQVLWAHLIYHPKYSDKVDMYEGGYMHSRGIYRSEATSCMNNNIPYYSAISRQAIVERIMECAGETFDFDAFAAKDSFEVATKASNHQTAFDWTFGVDPKFNRGSERGSVIYMGDHPNVK